MPGRTRPHLRTTKEPSMTESTAEIPRPLEGVTVVDLTIALAGPYATLLLSGLGARVIKVENPDGGDRVRNNAPYFGREGLSIRRQHDDDMSLGVLERTRGKESVTLNLKDPAAAEVFADLVRHADIVVENYSRGTADRLGVGYAAAQAANPRIVYCSISGFGAGGVPGAGKAMDAIIQALSGTMMTSGEDGDPPVRVGIPVGDLSAPLFAVIGILGALRQAEATGIGQHVDVSMLGSLTALVAGEQSHLLEPLGRSGRTGRFMPRLAPFGVFRTEDGWVAICAPETKFAEGVLAALGQPELCHDERFASRDGRVEHADELHELIEEWTRTRTTEDVVATLEARGVPCAPVRRPAEAVGDELLLSRGDTMPLRHPAYGSAEGLIGSGLPVHLSRSRTGYLSSVPALGEDNERVYRDLLGYSGDRIDELAGRGVIG
ncbi:CaiB/BaiF CoA transferase family protein [Actinoallomurus sp. CA-142502]|uniref:CaiB/BaiF CoA transferase family protein n=1 Tax=Actinoallomurus sp. CA-142502 TaxID=3239885 RepID=UPI003D89DEC1